MSRLVILKTEINSKYLPMVRVIVPKGAQYDKESNDSKHSTI